MASLFDDYYGKFKERMKDQKGVYAFRGQADEKWELESSARTRMKNKDKDFTKEDLASHLKTQFINPAKLNGWGREEYRELYDLEILARFQHYGAATCLLDFTRSFHVALWFACQEENNKNGRVFVINTNDVENFKKIEMEDIKKNDLEGLLYTQKSWYWDLENLTDRVARQNSVFIFGGNNLSKGKQYEAFKIDHRDKKPLIKEMEDLFDLRPENLFKDIFGLASINKRDDLLPPDDPDDSFKAGNESYQKGDYDGAIRHYSKAIELKSDFVEAYNNRGATYNEKGEHDLAIEDLNEAIELNQNYADAYNNRGIAYQKKREYARAIEDLNEAIKLDSNDAVAYNNRGIAHVGNGEYDRAIENYNTAIDLKSDYAEAYYNRGLVYIQKENYDQTVKDFSKAIELKPDFAIAYARRGLIYTKEEKYNHAIEDFNKAIELKRDYGEAYFGRSLAYQFKGEPDKAVADFAEAERLGYKLPSDEDPKKIEE